jgi:hypothetical protein
MKKQTIQFILGFFLIFSALPAFADFPATISSGFHMGTSPVVCFPTKEASCLYMGRTWANDKCSANGRNWGFLTCNDAKSCPSNSTLNASTCTCNAPYRQDMQIGLLTTTTVCSYPYNSPSSDIQAYAIGAGLFAGGTAAGLATCTFGLTPTCIASAVSALAGAGLAAATYLNSSDTLPVTPAPDPCANKTCVTVQLDPNKPIGAQTFVSRDSNGNFKPEGSGWTNNGNGTHTTNVTDGQVTVDTNTDRVSSVLTNNSGTWSAAIQSGNLGGGLEFVAQGQNLETSYTQQFTGSFNEQGVQQSQKQASTGTKPSTWNYNGALTGGGSGGGSGGGTDTGTGGGGTGTGTGGDCAEYGCAKETTLNQVLQGLKGSSSVTDNAGAASGFISSLSSELGNLTEGYANEMNNAIDDFFQNSGIESMFDTLGDFNPLADIATECSYSGEFLGKTLTLSYCEQQESLHWIIAFIMFCIFATSIIHIILERPNS